MTNPLLQWPHTSSFFDDAIPFEQITPEHFLEALEPAYLEAIQNINIISNLADSPTFENTIFALETASEHFEYVTGTYFNLFSAEASEELQALAQKISPKSAELSSFVLLNDKLFSRVKKLWDTKDQLKLFGADAKLLEKTYLNFTRNGALLNEADKVTLKKIDQELAVLSPQFSENVLKATNQFFMHLTEPSEVEGLPEFALQAAQEEAKKRGYQQGWVFTLHMPSYLPFIQYAHNRTLREKIWRAQASKAFNQEGIDNQPVILKSVQLRAQRAQLLGYPTHAHFILEERMAKTPEQVYTFLNTIYEAAEIAAKNDFKEVQNYAKQLGLDDELKPWDFTYYSEKLKQNKFNYNEEDLRPYFQLENVIQGVFDHAHKLYELNFKERTDIPKYHEDVKTYEVTDSQTGQYIALFYADFFPRNTKKSGAWMTAFRDQGYHKGSIKRPHVSIVCNFTKPTQDKPSLLSYDEVQTLFHEFGHALHGMLSKISYRSISGTNVFWDFVELPSQIMENWVAHKEGLNVFAKHYLTNNPLPNELIDKMKASQNFLAGYNNMRQLNFSYLDMAWHNLTSTESINSVSDFEKNTTQKTRLFAFDPTTNSSCSFSHIFAGGYSAGYYSYKWAEVLDADAFEYFLENGIFNPMVAKKFKENILTQGALEHPEILYKKFRGRSPDPKALLRRDGLIPK